MTKVPITLNINNEKYTLNIKPNTTLLELLRDELDLTGSKESCGEGVCGSCTVLLENKPIRSCLTLALEVEGMNITTIEGLEIDDKLDPLQQKFIDHGAVQCGFCTPGMIISAKGLLLEDPLPDEKKIRSAISGNICRCTGYAKMVDAIKDASKK